MHDLVQLRSLGLLTTLRYTYISHIAHIYFFFFTFLPFPVQERSYHTGFRVREINAGDAYRCHYLINDEAEVTRFVCL